MISAFPLLWRGRFPPLPQGYAETMALTSTPHAARHTDEKKLALVQKKAERGAKRQWSPLHPRSCYPVQAQGTTPTRSLTHRPNSKPSPEALVTAQVAVKPTRSYLAPPRRSNAFRMKAGPESAVPGVEDDHSFAAAARHLEAARDFVTEARRKQNLSRTQKLAVPGRVQGLARPSDDDGLCRKLTVRGRPRRDSYAAARVHATLARRLAVNSSVVPFAATDKGSPLRQIACAATHPGLTVDEREA
ncbi:hypothetical protein P8C59_004123 [Phyllachora maydis]|uniref:Uncharacterized protein n=1 Tax=Phyllachora maydis TaxID=1825666 RepID=A0AAD9MD47_9PEZI|nr:hypothetical protein P8C59_004123 [Phyllachora maydis]